jgi:hypothetical protein
MLCMGRRRALKAARAAAETQNQLWCVSFESNVLDANAKTYYAAAAAADAAFAACSTLMVDAGKAAWLASLWVRGAVVNYVLHMGEPGIAGEYATIHNSVQALEETEHASLLRCIFGNPFEQSLAVDKTWVSWNDGLVAKLAYAIYEERAFERMPILADALLDAGCNQDELIDHLRVLSPHSRGCWVLDALLCSRVPSR